MRGEDHSKQKSVALPVIRTKKISHIAIISDEEGRTVYLIKATWWANAVLVLFLLMLLISVLLAGAIYINYKKALNIEERIEQKHD